MSKNYYINSLYPLQDMVLDLVRNVDDTFYLTGGTALGRIYLRHRYSDDLYLFVNREEKFKDLSNNIISQLQKHFSMIEMALLGEDFARIFIHHDNGLSLKIEMVNDVLFRVGEIQAADFFHRVDSWQNILSNKVCALSRDEAKDIADIIFLSSKYNFVWEAMINHARQKDNWVNEIIVSKMIYEFDIRRLRNINWIEDPEYETLQQACTIISRDILDGGENSLPQQSGDH